MKFLLFVLINFGALALGGILQGEGPGGTWYQQLRIAPWTPPGWVFGAAWTSIMICFAIYMSTLVRIEKSAWVLTLFGIQLVLNILWNPVFFHFHFTGWSLILIVALFLVVLLLFLMGYNLLKAYSLLLVPYLLWLGIATSLNAYAWLKN